MTIVMSNIRFPIKNLMFFKASNLVFLSPETLRYSHDLIAKNNAPMNNSQRAKSIGETEDL